MFKFVVAFTLLAACSASVYVPSDFLVRDGLRPSGGFALRATGERGPAATIPAEHMAAAPVVPAVEYVAPVVEYVAPMPVAPVVPMTYEYIHKPIESSYSYARVAQGFY